MQTVDFKTALNQIKKGEIRPFYWVSLQEHILQTLFLNQLKLKLIKNPMWEYQTAFGSEVQVQEFAQRIQSRFIGAEKELIVLRDAHLLANMEYLTALLKKHCEQDPVKKVVVFFFDGAPRKKVQQEVFKIATVLPELKIYPSQYGAWIDKFAQYFHVVVNDVQKARLQVLDPWSLDLVCQEIQKNQLMDVVDVDQSDPQKLSTSELFLDVFLAKKPEAPLYADAFGNNGSSDFFQNMGLLAWYVRQLIQFKTSGIMSSFEKAKIEKYASLWSVEQLHAFNKQLLSIDCKAKSQKLNMHAAIRNLCLWHF